MITVKKNYKVYSVIFFFSLLLVFVAMHYTQQPGFIIGINTDASYRYSTELLSSGGDDFDVFQFASSLSIAFLFIIPIVFLVEYHSKKDISRQLNQFTKRFFYCVYGIQLFILFSINLDISLWDSILFGDYILLIWMTVFVVEIFCVSFLFYFEKMSSLCVQLKKKVRYERS